MTLQSPTNEQVIAGRIARGAIQLARELCPQGIDGIRLDNEIEQFIRDKGGAPALKGYHPPFTSKPYEWTICLAVDKDVVHGVPTKLVGVESLVTVDLVVEYQGWYADTARTFYVGAKHPDKKQFADASWIIFETALGMIQPAQSINLFSTIVAQGAELHDYAVINEYCGHGIGEGIHLPPQILNKPSQSQGNFQIGQSYAVEPVLACQRNYILDSRPNDGFSVRANCLASHNEDTIFVGPNGIVNLTGNES